jgi:hypothetical protein
MTDGKVMTNATVTQATAPVNVSLPTPPAPPPTIVAQDLVAPDFLHFRPVNPAHALRWMNRVAGNGTRYDAGRAMGYRNATLVDISKETPVPAAYIQNNAIINGDIILMIVDKAKYDGALKQNEERALARLKPSVAMATGAQQLGNALNEVDGSPQNKAKISLFPATR